MPEASETPSLPSVFGDALKRHRLRRAGLFAAFLQSVWNIFTPPQYWADTLEQMDLIGVGSLPIIIAAALSIGGVMVLHTASQFLSASVKRR